MCYLILLQQPWYKGFTGTIVHTEPQRYLMYGNVARLNTTTIEITELPIGCWTQTYKENVLKPTYKLNKVHLQRFLTCNTPEVTLLCTQHFYAGIG